MRPWLSRDLAFLNNYRKQLENGVGNGVENGVEEEVEKGRKKWRMRIGEVENGVENE